MPRPRRSNFHLPEGVYFKHGAYHYQDPKTRRWRRLGSTIEEVDSGMKSIGIAGAVMPDSHLRTVIAHTKKNAKSRGIPFALTNQHVADLWARSRGRCELTGIRMDLVKTGAWRRRPFAPSIDRIDSGQPYTPANCRLVCVAMNLALNEWGEAVFRRIANGFLGHRERTGVSADSQIADT